MTKAERDSWQLQAQTIGLTLADFIRIRVGQAKEVGRTPKQRRRLVHKTDPELLATLARIGNNLNQVAKWANTYKNQTDALEILSALVSIENMLSSYSCPSTEESNKLGVDSKRESQ
jgi:hypothetical protein